MKKLNKYVSVNWLCLKCIESEISQSGMRFDFI